MAVTPNYGLTKPVVGADTDAWGTMLNGDLDIIDAEIFKKAAANNPVFTGIVTAPAFVGDPVAILRPKTDGPNGIQFQKANGTLIGRFDTDGERFFAGVGGIQSPIYHGQPLILRPLVDGPEAIQMQSFAGTKLVTLDTSTAQFGALGSIRTPLIYGDSALSFRPGGTDAANVFRFLKSDGTIFASFDSQLERFYVGAGGIDCPVYSGSPVVLRPNGDTSSAVQIRRAGGTVVASFDTSAGRLAIGSVAATSKCALDIQGIEGFGVPILTTAQRNALAPPRVGVLVFDSDLQKLFVTNSVSGWSQITGS